MRRACHDILYTVVNSRAYAGEVRIGMEGWMKILIGIDAAVILLAAAIEILMVRKFRKRS